MKIKDLRSMSKEDLNSKLIELRKELIKHNAQIAVGTTPKSPGQVRGVKKTIAKIMTIVGTQKFSSKSEKVKKEEPKVSKPSKEEKEGKKETKKSSKKSEEE